MSQGDSSGLLLRCNMSYCALHQRRPNDMTKPLTALAITAVVLGSALGVSSTASAADAKSIQTGAASWYGPGFHGKRTASGERFNTNDLTAAHKTLPFGSRVRVTNERTGKSVVVRINDRGPYAHGRVSRISASDACSCAGAASLAQPGPAGHYRYYGVIFNYRALRVFKDCVVRLWRKVLGKRSQKGRVSWASYKSVLTAFPLPEPVLHQAWHG